MSRFNLTRSFLYLAAIFVLMGSFSLNTRSQTVVNANLLPSVSLGNNYEQIIDVSNQNPPEELTFPDGSTEAVIYEDEFVEITGPERDPDGDSVFYYWNVNGGSFTTTDPINFTHAKWTPPDVSFDTTFRIYAVAGDGRGYISESRFYITVKNRSGGHTDPNDGNDGSSNEPNVGQFSVIDPQMEIKNFPQVQLTFGLKEAGQIVDNLFGRHFTVIEEGRRNNNSMIVLPPKTPLKQIDLSILIDQSGNVKEYEEQIRSNIKSLIQYMRSEGLDLKVQVSSFDNNDRDGEVHFNEYLGSDPMVDQKIETLTFDEERLDRANALSNLFYFTGRAPDSYRQNAEKIALIINGSQIHSNERDESIQYSMSEIIKNMKEGHYTVFVAGHPIKQVYRVSGSKSEVGSLTQSLPGGYLGSFNADLTQIYDLLKQRTPDRYTLVYYSRFSNPYEASGSLVQLGAANYELFNKNYIGLSVNEPTFKKRPLKKDKPGIAEVQIDIDHHGTFINAVEIGYMGTDDVYHLKFLAHKRKESTDQTYRYYLEIPEDELFDDFNYSVSIYTPFGLINEFSQPVAEEEPTYDEGITLTPHLGINGDKKQVVWKWTGPTVALGSSFELWSGDTLIKEIKDSSVRQHVIDIDECSRYQVVKLRVNLPSGVSHPKAGGFSDFSKDFEYFVGEDNPFTEKQVMELALQCLDAKTLNDISSIDALKPGFYKETEWSTLNTGLSYITGAMGQSFHELTRFSHFTKTYWNLGYISDDDFDQHWDGEKKPPQSIFYKVITRINRSKNFEQDYDYAIQKTRGQRDGGSSI